jgi:hypothetical protein
MHISPLLGQIIGELKNQMFSLITAPMSTIVHELVKFLNFQLEKFVKTLMGIDHNNAPYLTFFDLFIPNPNES